MEVEVMGMMEMETMGTEMMETVGMEMMRMMGTEMVGATRVEMMGTMGTEMVETMGTVQPTAPPPADRGDRAGDHQAGGERRPRLLGEAAAAPLRAAAGGPGAQPGQGQAGAQAGQLQRRCPGGPRWALGGNWEALGGTGRH